MQMQIFIAVNRAFKELSFDTTLTQVPPLVGRKMLEN